MLHQERELLKFSRNIFFTLRMQVVKVKERRRYSIAANEKQKEIVIPLSYTRGVG